MEGTQPEARDNREKYWKELTDTEKIERMREQVKTLQRIVKQFTFEMEKLQSDFASHSHSGDKILKPILPELRFGPSSISGVAMGKNSRDPEEVYF